MDKIRIVIKYQDNEYSDALAKALLLKCRNIELCSKHDPPPDAIFIDESTVPLFQSVPDIIRSIMAMANMPQAPAKPLEKVVFTAFCSGIGGGGLSTAALCYARLNSRIFGLKTAFVSFDPIYRNSFSNEDEYGLKFVDSSLFSDLNYLKNILADTDELVLDIPWGCENYGSILDCCDRRIVISGFDERRKSVSEKFHQSILKSAENYINPPKTFYFENHYDQALDTADIHSQLGKEMLTFMKTVKEFRI